MAKTRTLGGGQSAIAILLQVAGARAFLACLYTLQAGQATRRYYEAEWAIETNTLIQRIDHALATADGPEATTTIKTT
ncbi:hypothetical protein [Nodosilinea sp. E11]|uniref:hypothetical protein n=1 Tax=Nodosilinea sp. E11 TaxID=3037479 RepID=UPI0029342CBE|nr:hypothetical protein [Nodosilinea sp. E11]WOD39700.1 hypothetical protein RRF56_26200 [Nodosilinea sp. E11]